MPATRINPVRVSQTGINSPAPVAADLVNGNSVPNVEGVQVILSNTGGSPVTVTFKTSARVEGYAVADYTASVPASGRLLFGHFSRTLFGNDVEFQCSAACDVTATY